MVKIWTKQQTGNKHLKQSCLSLVELLWFIFPHSILFLKEVFLVLTFKHINYYIFICVISFFFFFLISCGFSVVYHQAIRIWSFLTNRIPSHLQTGTPSNHISPRSANILGCFKTLTKNLVKCENKRRCFILPYTIDIFSSCNVTWNCFRIK